MNATPRLLTASALALALSVSTRTVWRWARQGVLPPPVRLTRRSPRWDVEAVRQRLQASA